MVEKRNAPPPQAASTTKISATIYEFAEPVLEQIVGEGGGVDHVRDGLALAITVWNACVLDDHRSGSWVQQARIALDKLPHKGFAALGAFEMLVRRKRERYLADDRIVGPWEILPDGTGGYRLQATALALPPP